MWHQWFNHNVMKLGEYFWVQRKQKLWFYSTILLNITSSINTSAYTQHARDAADVEHCRAYVMVLLIMVVQELLNKLFIFVFFAHNKYSPSFVKIKVEPLISHGLFYWFPYCVSGNISVVLLSMHGQRALGCHQQYLNLCHEDIRRSYGFGTTWRWVFNHIIYIFGWTIALTKLTWVKPSAH